MRPLNSKKFIIFSDNSLGCVWACTLFSMLLLSACALRPAELSTDMPRLVAEEEKMAPEIKDDLQDAYKNFTLSSRAMLEGRSQEARKLLSEAIEKDPKSFYMNLKMGLLLKDMRDYQAAFRYANKCLALQPKNPDGLELLGDLYALTDQDDLAIEQYEKALTLNPGKRRVRLLLTTILIRKENFQSALDHLETLVKQDPEMVTPHYYIGRINLELKHYYKAEKAILEALKLNDSLEPALFDLATLYQLTDRELKSVEIYEKLLDFYPDNTSARERLLNLYFKLGLKEKGSHQIQRIKEQYKPGDPGRQTLGLLYLRQGKLNESIEELNLIVSAWPNDNKSRYYLAAAYEEKGETENALEHFRAIKTGSQYYVNAQIHIAHLLNTQKKYQEAVAVLRNAIGLEKARTELYLMLASIYETLKDYDKALEVIREGLKQDEKDVDLIFRLGVVYDKAGDKDSCIKEMQKVLQINPDHAESLNYIGYTYAEKGIKLDEAMEFIQKAIKLKPDSGYIMDSLGWVYYKKGLYDEAVDYLEKAAKLTPDDPTINEHLGDAYLKKKEHQKALECYKKALSLEPPDKDKLIEKISNQEKLLEQ